jgi:hypothetical protein
MKFQEIFCLEEDFHALRYFFEKIIILYYQILLLVASNDFFVNILA